jgi:hypothetical protein
MQPTQSYAIRAGIAGRERLLVVEDRLATADETSA